MRRRLLLFVAIVAAVLLLSMAALPLWLGGVVGWAGASRGLKFSRYERIGYSRFALHDVEVKTGNVRVTVSRIEGDTPLLWWRHETIVGGKWSVDVAAPTKPAVPPAVSKPSGWMPLQGLLTKIANQLEKWVPHLTAGAGVVRWPGAELNCDSAAWSDRTLAVKALTYRAIKVDGTVAFPGDALKVALKGADYGLTVESHGADAKGEGNFWAQPATLAAHFGEQGWLPAEMTLQAMDWTLPGERLKMGGVYESVQGRGKIEWREQKLSAELGATSTPVKGGKSVPPLDVTLRGHGDVQAFTVEALNAVLPGVVAKLTEPVTFERSGKFKESAAKFTIEVDLAKQPWLPDAKGTATGEATWTASFGQAPVVAFQAAARDFAVKDWTLAAAEAQGRFAWPQVKVTEGAVTGTNGEKLAWHAGWDFKTKEILEAAVDGQIRRATVARWVPEGILFDVVTVKAQAAGPLTAVKHAGSAQAEGVKVHELNPLNAVATWAGAGAALDKFSADVTMGTTKVSAEGALSEGTVRLAKLELAQGGAERLHLTGPAVIHWKPGVEVERLRLEGPDGALDVATAWGESGRLDAEVRNFSSAWLGDLGVLKGPAWKVAALTAKGTWARGPMEFTLKGNGALEFGEGKSAAVSLAAHGGADGVKIEELGVVEDGKNVVKVIGQLPLRVSPGGAQKVVFEDSGALVLDATTEPNAGFWQQLATFTGFELKQPEASAHVTGTWAKPQGTVRVKAARLATDAARFKHPMPTIEALDVELSGDAGQVRLERLAVVVEGQTVRATARLPVEEGKWREFLTNPVTSVQRGTEAHLEVPEADLAALARFLPVFMAPKGRVQVDVGYKGGALSGALKLHDAATRPLGPLGVLQNIGAEVAFEGRKIELRSVSAESGGQKVTLSGNIELPDEATTAQPNVNLAEKMKFNVTMKGENLPFVRQMGVLVRGDLDLKLVSPARGTPQITGSVRLRDSLFLSDIRALLPSGVRTRATTPPYFAVEVAPYNAWRIDVAVQGERFFKLRTALFTGVATARVQLSGTLGEPVARGEATVDDGLVKLPFATFKVQEGRVVMSPEQGLEPQLTLVATVRRLGYDLKMEATGAASAPVLVFSSSPPLESGQVLLMVMAGEAPHSDTAVTTEQQRAARLGTFLGQSLLSSFSGDGQMADRVSVSSGENVSQQGRETYGFEYKLNEKWSVVGEYPDEFDDWNIGLKWRVYTKGGTPTPPSEKKK